MREAPTPTHTRIARMRRSTVGWSAALAAGSLAALGWAIWPDRTEAEGSNGPGTAVDPTRPQVAVTSPARINQPPAIANTLNQAAFQAPIWRMPPKPKAEVPVIPPPPPLRLQLLAIDSAGDRPRIAIIYDQDLDTPVRVGEGDSYRRFMVTVLKDRVEFTPEGTTGPRIVLVLDTSAVGGPR